MLSISLSKGGSQQADYYLNLARADYYLSGGEPLGRWFGKGAKLLQLEGDVDGDAFRNLVAGFFPNGRKAMVQNAGAADRQGGWDLCFSAPKSVSVLWSIAPECWKREIEVAHDLAVRAALSYLEQEAGYTRRGKDGLVTEKVGFVAALFEHGTSRANDPQLHTHAFLLNVGVREDGTTGTIVSRPTFIHKMAAGALYRAELAFQLTKRLPIALEVERTWFEIKGISKTLMETFSTRRAEIMEALKAYGERNATAAKRAAVETRGGKLHVPRSELFERWRAEAERHGHQYATLRDDLAAERPLMSRTPKLEPDKVVHELTIKDSHFTERTLVRALAERSQTGGISAEMILDAARRKVRSLYELELHNDERQFTTMAMLRLEKELFDRADAGRLDTRHVVPKPLVDQVLRDIVLSEEQGKAVRQITQEPGRVQIVQGWAGVGKSTLLAAARRVWEKEGYTVIGLALSGKAAESLEKSSGIKSITLARALTDIERHGWHTAWQPLFPGCPKWNPAHRLGAPFARYEPEGIALGKKVILVLDEASMVGTRQFNELLGHTEAAKTKLVGVGDRQQLPALEAGRPFPALGDRLGQAELTDIQRQHTPWMREMVKAFAEGRVADALRELAVRERIHVADTPDAAQRELITHWHRAGKPKDSLILTSTHEDVDGLNRMAQAKRLEEGDIAGKSVAVRDERFFVGDRVVFEERSKIFGVENGSLGTVVGIRNHALGLWDDLLTVELDNRKQVHIPLKHYSKVGLGYAMTTHSAQGQTTQNAFVFVSGLMQTLKSSYVQASRPKENAHFFMDKEISGEGLDDLLTLMSKKDDKLMASDLVARASAKGSAQSAKAQAAPDPHETPDHDGHSR